MAGLILALLMLQAPAGNHPAARLKTAPSFEALSREAVSARDANRLDEAMALYKKALQLKPDWDEGWWTYGSIAYDLNKYAECASAFRRLTTLKADDAPAWTMSGLCEYSLKNYDAALEEPARNGAPRLP